MYSIALQAGGKSSRMGQDKSLLAFNKEPLIQRIIRRLSVLSDHIFITTDDVSRYSFTAVPAFRDVYPGYGALGGVVTALKYAREDYVAILACDMPFINPNLLAAQFEHLLHGGYDVVIPSSGHGLEPMHAVYRRETCLPEAIQAIHQNKKRVISWFSQVRVKAMSREEVLVHDPDLRSFLNVNTPEEFREAEKMDRLLAGD